jgi:hypothetical protein
MNKIRLLLVTMLALCLVQVDKVTVPSMDTTYKDLRFVTYDAAKREFVDYGMREQMWCQDSASSLGREICFKPYHIPAKDKLIFSLRADVFKEEKWQYLAASAIYLEQARRPDRQKDESGKTYYVFDCSALPFVPPGMEVVMHSVVQFEWSPHKVRLHSLQSGRGDALVTGCDFLKSLAGQQTLNGTALEYLLSSPFLIPMEWRDRQIFFLGTIYRDRAQAYYFATLFYEGKRWAASTHRLDYEMYANSVAAAILV